MHRLGRAVLRRTRPTTPNLPRQTMKLNGSTIVVTGCSSGIGAEAVRELRHHGARVIGMDRNEPSLTLDGFVKADLSVPELIDEAVSQLPPRVDRPVQHRRGARRQARQRRGRARELPGAAAPHRARAGPHERGRLDRQRFVHPGCRLARSAQRPSGIGQDRKLRRRRRPARPPRGARPRGLSVFQGSPRSCGR